MDFLMKSIFVICLIFFVLMTPSVFLGSNNTENTIHHDEKKEHFNISFEKLKKEHENETPKQLIQNRGLPFTVSKEMQEDLGRILYNNHKMSLEHNRRLFEWQLQSSRIIFWVVIGLVVVGIIFSGIQFAKALKLPPQQTEKERQEQLTELEITTRGIKVSSPVLGVVILVISLGFFYLFLIHVYPVQHVQEKTSHVSSVRY